jgi:hypothetical protein
MRGRAIAADRTRLAVIKCPRRNDGAVRRDDLVRVDQETKFAKSLHLPFWQRNLGAGTEVLTNDAPAPLDRQNAEKYGGLGLERWPSG